MGPPTASDIRWNMDKRVYIGAMGEGANKEEVEEACQRYGAVKHVWVARKPAGFAFVEFYERRAAEDAVRKLNGSWLNGRRVCVEMSTGEPKFTADGRLRTGSGLRRSPIRKPIVSSARSTPRFNNRLPQREYESRRSCCDCYCHRYDNSPTRYSRSNSAGRSGRNERSSRRGRSRSYNRSRSRSRSYQRSRSPSRSRERRGSGDRKENGLHGDTGSSRSSSNEKRLKTLACRVDGNTEKSKDSH